MWTPLKGSGLEFTLTEIYGSPRQELPVTWQNSKLYWEGTVLRADDFRSAYWKLSLSEPARLRVTINGFSAEEFLEADPAQLRSFYPFSGETPTQTSEGISPTTAEVTKTDSLMFYSGNIGLNRISADFLIEVFIDTSKKPWWYCAPKEHKPACPERPTGFVPFENYDSDFKFPISSSRTRKEYPCDAAAEVPSYPTDPTPVPDPLNGQMIVFTAGNRTGGDPTVVVPTGGDWEYALVPNHANPSWDQLVPPTTGWLPGQGPFGDGSATYNTQWPAGQILWIRRTFTTNSKLQYRITATAHNGATFLVNDYDFAWINSGETAGGGGTLTNVEIPRSEITGDSFTLYVKAFGQVSGMTELSILVDTIPSGIGVNTYALTADNQMQFLDFGQSVYSNTPVSASVSPSGRFVVFMSGSGVEIFRHDGMGRLTALDPVINSRPGSVGAWSPDESMFIMAHINAPYLVVYAHENGILQRLNDPAGFTYTSAIRPLCPAFSPDGKFVIVPVSGGTQGFVLYERAGNTLTKLPDFAGKFAVTGYSAAWHPDGEMLVLGYGGTTYLQLHRRIGDTLSFISGAFTGKQVVDYPRHISFTEDGSRMVVAVDSDPTKVEAVAMYSVAPLSFTKLPPMPGGGISTATVTSAVISSDGQGVVSSQSATAQNLRMWQFDDDLGIWVESPGPRPTNVAVVTGQSRLSTTLYGLYPPEPG